MFYTFMQNNSGGVFHFDGVTGITQIVIIEADSADTANSIAESIGIYFNGCDDGTDCSCCGDRWSAQWDDDKSDAVPSIYGVPVEDVSGLVTFRVNWMGENPDVYIHYADGMVKPYNTFA